MIKYAKPFKPLGIEGIFPVCLGCFEFMKENEIYMYDDELEIVYHLRTSCMKKAIHDELLYRCAPLYFEVNQ